MNKLTSKFTACFKEDTSYKIFFVTILITGIGYGLYSGMLDNYLAKVVGMGEFDRGITEFFREIPGLLLVLLLAVLYSFTAEKLYKLGAAVIVVGLGMLAIIPPDKALVTAAIMIYSMGEHIQLGMKSTLTLTYCKKDKDGEALGYQTSLFQIGNLVGFLVIMVAFFLLKDVQPFKPFLFVAAGVMALSMLLSFKIKGESATDKSKSRFYFRKKFYKYYMLEVFYGARKQVFLTFGPYVLILFYGADATVISLLFAVSAICCYFMAPLVGKLIDRMGYKFVMVGDTLVLVIVCFFYGFAHHLFPRDVAFVVCCVNYVLDSIISLASMASNVYVKDISDSQEEMKATISTGISVNHLITIIIALCGGWIWQTLGIEMLFILSAVLGLCNSAYAATIKKKPQTS